MAKAPRPHGRSRYVHKLEMSRDVPAASVEIAGMRERIAELEEMVAAAPYLERKRREAMRDWVPPVDESAAGRGNSRRLTKQEQKVLARERRRHILFSLVLVVMLIGLLNWLAQLLRV